MSTPVIGHVSAEHAVNWLQELEELHEQSSRTHFIDVWIRRAILARMGRLSAEERLLTLGVRLPFGIRDPTVLARPALAHPRGQA